MLGVSAVYVGHNIGRPDIGRARSSIEFHEALVERSTARTRWDGVWLFFCSSGGSKGLGRGVE